MVYWFPWYPSRFKSETMHLKAAEDGIYRRLIDHYMETGKPLPNSPAVLARIAGVSLNEFRRASAAVLAFFDEGDDGALHQSRCDKTLQRQADRRKSLSERGQKGGRPPKKKLMVYWFPWYPDRFKSETIHLKAAEGGIYRRLIDYYMETGKPLPNSPAVLARIAGVSLNEFRRASAAVLAFFDEGDDGALHQSRCDKTLQRQADRRKSLSERGRKGGRPPKKKLQESQSEANEKQIRREYKRSRSRGVPGCGLSEKRGLFCSPRRSSWVGHR